MAFQRKVATDEAGMRLDRWLRLWCSAPQGALERIARRGGLEVNGKRARPSLRVAQDDEVLAAGLEARSVSPAAEGDGDWLAHRTLLRTQDMLIIDKPAGLASQGGVGIGRSVASLAGSSARLAHRLDKGVSGAMALALSRASAAAFMRALGDGMVDKVYGALTAFPPREAKGRVEGWLAPALEGGMAETPSRAMGARWAATDWRVCERKGNLAWLEFKPLTGRKHQIRVHAQTMGMPLWGDARYGKGEVGGIMLHARALGLRQDAGAFAWRAEAPWPKRITALWARAADPES